MFAEEEMFAEEMFDDEMLKVILMDFEYDSELSITDSPISVPFSMIDTFINDIKQNNIDAVITKINSINVNQITTIIPNVTYNTDIENHEITAIFMACLYGHEEIVKLLLDAGAEIEVPDDIQGSENDIIPLPSPLCAAIFSENVSLVRLLLSRGANVNTADDWGYTPLHYASCINQAEIIQLLIQHGANIDPTTSDEKYTPLHMVFISHRGQFVPQLLMPTETFINGLTYPVTIPIRDKTFTINHDTQLAAAKILLNAGASPNSADQTDYTILESVIEINNLHAIELLLRHHVRLRIMPFVDLKTEIHFALELNQNDAVFLLVRAFLPLIENKTQVVIDDEKSAEFTAAQQLTLKRMINVIKRTTPLFTNIASLGMCDYMTGTDLTFFSSACRPTHLFDFMASNRLRKRLQPEAIQQPVPNVAPALT